MHKDFCWYMSHTKLLSAGLEPGKNPFKNCATTQKYKHIYGCLPTFWS